MFAASAATPDWWDPNTEGLSVVAAWKAKGAASYAASKTNLANPETYDLVDEAAPAWAADTGWTFNGSTQKLYANVYVDSDWSVLFQFSGVSGSTAGMSIQATG